MGRDIQFDLAAFTLELGNAMQLDPTAVHRGLQGIKRYLVQQGLLHDIALSPVESATTLLTRSSQLTKYYAPAGGLIQNRAEPGTWVKPGTLLYALLSFNKAGQLPQVREVRSEHAGLIYDVAINHAVNQGEYVLALLQPDG